MQIAFYKGTHSGVPGLYNRLVRWWTKGPYSHVELVFSDGLCASSSHMDGGVRFKWIDLDPERWDVYELPAYLEPAARRWFEVHKGAGYDLLGNLHFVIPAVGHSKERYFCSEADAAALGFPDPWRYDPNTLASAIHVFHHHQPADMAGFSL